MAMEVHVLFRGQVPSKAALARALRLLGFPFTIPDAKGSLAQQSGYLPMKLRREETGVEFDLFDRSAVAEFEKYGCDQSYEHVASFRWGGDAQEGAAAHCSAAALAKLTGGAVFDEGDAKLLSLDEAIGQARQFLDTLPKPDQRFGTRPADIRRYLKPLLAMRSDLVLRGRFLLIRPVRHILRGAVFDRTSDKYTFKIWRYLAFLHDASWDHAELGQPIAIEQLEVWQPHFLPVLFDLLSEDVFAHVGPTISFSTFAQQFEGIEHHYGARVQALVLAGEPHRARELIAQLERRREVDPVSRQYTETLRAFVERHIESVWREFHAKEAERAKLLKIEDIWEPSPFPAEISEKGRTTTSDEPTFQPNPWISKPLSLIQSTPASKDDVRFATLVHRRNDGVVLFGALTREGAQDRHRNGENYIVTTRLSEGQLLVVKHMTHWSPYDPDQPPKPNILKRASYHVWIHGGDARLLATFDAQFADPTIVRMTSVSIRDHRTWTQVWYGYNVFREGRKLIYDHRTRPHLYNEYPLTETDLHLCQFSKPEFMEIDEFVRRATQYLRQEGFGRSPI